MRVGSILIMDVTFLAQILDDLRLPFPGCLGAVTPCWQPWDWVAWQVTAWLQARWDKAAWDDAGMCQC